MHLLRNSMIVATVLFCVAALHAQDTDQLAREDARLNQVYQQRVWQLRSDPAALAALRRQERDWIRQRDQQCGKDVACLTQSTKAHADYFQEQVSQNDPNTKPGAPIPPEILGKWIIRKNLPVGGVVCWGEKQAQSLVGTALEYRAGSFLWKDKSIRSLGSKTSLVKAQEFAEANSGSGGAVTFNDLGIDAASAKQIEIQHPDIAVYDKTMDCCAVVPGETVLMKGPNTLILNICGVFYEATRADEAKN
jgi:uncharacterized protein YecT (DUF1311 family)